LRKLHERKSDRQPEGGEKGSHPSYSLEEEKGKSPERRKLDGLRYWIWSLLLRDLQVSAEGRPRRSPSLKVREEDRGQGLSKNTH